MKFMKRKIDQIDCDASVIIQTEPIQPNTICNDAQQSLR